jgi:SAM-dependent methyltransferase
MNYEEEQVRIRATYARRDSGGRRALYNWSHPDVLFRCYRFQSVATACLRRAGWEDLSNLRALDVGCGRGDWLRQLWAWGARPENLHGIDLLPDRIAAARQLAPGIDYREGGGWQLPFDDATMDLVSAHTVFSSILDENVRLGVAGEMARVLASRGCILIYDFRISHPLNPDTAGIRRPEICRLFPGFRQYSRSMTLAPQIARRFTPVAPLLTLALEALCPLLRTHQMYLLERSVEKRKAG